MRGRFGPWDRDPRRVWLLFALQSGTAPDQLLSARLDGTKTRGKPVIPLGPGKYTALARRLRLLKDRRLLALWRVTPMPADILVRQEFNKIVGARMMVSEDDENMWSQLIEVLPPKYRKNWNGEEFDAAELPNRGLLCVFRKGEKISAGKESRKKQGRPGSPARSDLRY